jgi:hypothetical protein
MARRLCADTLLERTAYPEGPLSNEIVGPLSIAVRLSPRTWTVVVYSHYVSPLFIATARAARRRYAPAGARSGTQAQTDGCGRDQAGISTPRSRPYERQRNVDRIGDAIQDSELGNRGWLSAFRLRKRFRKVLYASPETHKSS